MAQNDGFKLHVSKWDLLCFSLLHNLTLLTSTEGLNLDSNKHDLLILLPHLSGLNFW